MATTSEPAATSSSQPSSASLLSIRSVAKHFGKNVVLRDISLEIAEGEFLTILGESCSGKNTPASSSPPREKSGCQASALTLSLPIAAA